KQLIPATTPLIGFSGEIIWPIEQIQLLVKIKDKEHSASAWMNFMVVRSQSLYNGNIERLGFKKLQTVPSIAHGMLKILVEEGVITLKSSKLAPRNGSRTELILINPEGMEFTYALRFRFDATNNKAEYEALMVGLRIAEQMGVKNLQENMDSHLVANQVNRTYVAKDADMIRYLEKAINMQANQSARIQGATTNPAGSWPKDTSSDEVDDSLLNSADEIFQKELARLKGLEQKATSDAKSLGLGFVNDTEELQKNTSSKTVPPSSIPVHAGYIQIPAGATMVSTDDFPVHTSSSTDLFFNNKPITRFSCPSDLGNHDPSPGIFSSFSSDDEFGAALNNVASTMETTTGESTFISYLYDQQRDNHTDFQHCLFACFLSQDEPCSVAQALEDPSWVNAMQEEMQQFKFQNVWVLVDLPVGQGHRHEDGIDYDEVFATIARIEAIRLFLAFPSYMGFMVYQMDVKSAFLYRRINEEVYVTQPKGFMDPQHPKKVYKVVKALYGLHQALRAWYATLSTFLLKHGNRRGTINKTLFLKKNNRDIILV
nr:hypothetical protein [Tanacetum cinerariifolium]